MRRFFLLMLLPLVYLSLVAASPVSRLSDATPTPPVDTPVPPTPTPAWTPVYPNPYPAPAPSACDPTLDTAHPEYYSLDYYLACARCFVPPTPTPIWTPISVSTPTPAPTQLSCVTLDGKTYCAHPYLGALPVGHLTVNGAGTGWSAKCAIYDLGSSWTTAGHATANGWWPYGWDLGTTILQVTLNVHDATPGQGWNNACSGWVEYGNTDGAGHWIGTSTWHIGFDGKCGAVTISGGGSMAYRPGILPSGLKLCVWKDTTATLLSAAWTGHSMYYTTAHSATPAPTPMPSGICTNAAPYYRGPGQYSVMPQVSVRPGQCFMVIPSSDYVALPSFLGHWSGVKVCPVYVRVSPISWFGITIPVLDYVLLAFAAWAGYKILLRV